MAEPLDCSELVESSSATMESRDWSKLPDDILGLVIARFNHFNRAALAAVCRNWYSAVRQAPNRTEAWLMVSQDSDEFTHRLISMFDPFADVLIEVCFLSIGGHKVIGSSSDGWLTFVNDGSEVISYDPITNGRIQFPSVATLPNLNERYFSKFIYLPSSPFNRYSAAIIYGDNGWLAVTHPGEAEWIAVKDASFVKDIIFFNGLLYAVGISFDIFVCDLNLSPPKVTELIRFDFEQQFFDFVHDQFSRVHLVELKGEILLVVRNKIDIPGSLPIDYPSHSVDFSRTPDPIYLERTTEFKIFKMTEVKDMGGTSVGENHKKAKCQEVTELGNWALFLGINESVCLSTTEFPDLKQNSIYFTDHIKNYNESEEEKDLLDTWQNIQADVGIYDMEMMSIDRILESDKFAGFTWPPPIWFFTS